MAGASSHLTSERASTFACRVLSGTQKERNPLFRASTGILAAYPAGRRPSAPQARRRETGDQGDRFVVAVRDGPSVSLWKAR
jgi:hypothetical protein